MTDPNIQKIIKLTVTSGVKGQPLIVLNRTTGEKINTTIGDTAKSVIDLQNFTSGYTSGDVIDFIVSGERVGHTSLTTSGVDPESVTLSTSAITSGLSRGI